MANRCRKCDPPRSFANISKLRKHQWAEHRGMYEGKVQLPAPPAPSPEPAPAPVIRQRRASVRTSTPNGAFDTLQAALQGYQEARQALTEALLDATEAHLGHVKDLWPLDTTDEAQPPQQPKRKKRRVSPEGRANIAEAQRKRWAAKKATA